MADKKELVYTRTKEIVGIQGPPADKKKRKLKWSKHEEPCRYFNSSSGNSVTTAVKTQAYIIAPCA